MKIKNLNIKKFTPIIAIITIIILVTFTYSYELSAEEASLHTITLNQKYIPLYYNQTIYQSKQNSSIQVFNFINTSFNSSSASVNVSMIYSHPYPNLTNLPYCYVLPCNNLHQYGLTVDLSLFFTKDQIKTPGKLEFKVSNITEFDKNNSKFYNFSMACIITSSNPYINLCTNNPNTYGTFYLLYSKHNPEANAPGIYYLSFTISLYSVTDYSVSYIGSLGFYHLPWVRLIDAPSPFP